jgi:glycerol-3-phosphate dehydrogenase
VPDLTREAVLDGLDGSAFDVVVVGGGINGAGVARDAALRGLKVCLFEQGDFASGTSSKSTKIAHGGLRYLRNFEFGLVRESQVERLRLRRLLPHLVTPQSFCYPVYRNDPDSLLKVRLGVGVYTLLGGLKERSQALSAREVLDANPLLRAAGLAGAVRYWDDRMDDARIVLETVLSAEDAGATCLNYTKVTLVKARNNGFEVTYHDSAGGTEGSVMARAICNCAGPWADGLDGLTGKGRRLRPTKGVHIVVPRVEGDDALILDNPNDRRTFFAIPWEDRTLIGTTDTYYEGDPSDVCVEPADVAYLLDAANHYLPGASLSRSDVLHSFAGVRPLVAQGDDRKREGEISRSHVVFTRPDGVVTLLGGKFTTFRRMAQDATDALLENLGVAKRPCITTTKPYFAPRLPVTSTAVDPELWRRMKGRYGPRAGLVYDVCMSDPCLNQPICEDDPLRLGELVFALRHEKALYLDDLVQRRTRLSWRPLSALDAATLASTLAPYGLRPGVSTA